MTSISKGKDFVFIFIVDRSGSMRCPGAGYGNYGGKSRMDLAKDAMKLFMRSLPVDSKFAIISFGSHYEWMNIGGKCIIDYNDENAKAAIA